MRIIAILLAIIIILGGLVGFIGVIDPEAIQLSGSAEERKAFLSSLPLILSSLSALASGLVLLVLAGVLNATDSIKTQQRFAEMVLERLDKAGQAGQ
jgi:ABC-type cobalamin transport system permease subunit